jgi:hypothetical protein
MSGILAQNSGRHTGLVKAASSAGTWTLIKTLTASDSATLSFVDGTSDVTLDSTYDEYVFNFINIHAATDTANFSFNGSIDAGSNYNVAKTSTYFYASHTEAGADGQVSYNTNNDLAQGTGFQTINEECGNGNDECGSGYLTLFAPSSTTFVKHFIGRANNYHRADITNDNSFAGYLNTTSAVDAIQFKFSSGNIDSGSISLYGIS